MKIKTITMMHAKDRK